MAVTELIREDLKRIWSKSEAGTISSTTMRIIQLPLMTMTSSCGVDLVLVARSEDN